MCLLFLTNADHDLGLRALQSDYDLHPLAVVIFQLLAVTPVSLQLLQI